MLPEFFNQFPNIAANEPLRVGQVRGRREDGEMGRDVHGTRGRYRGQGGVQRAGWRGGAAGPLPAGGAAALRSRGIKGVAAAGAAVRGAGWRRWGRW